MLYLAEVEYEVSHYMVDGRERYEEIRLVEADSKQEAKEKVEKHYEDKTSEYSVCYMVLSVGISEVIK